MSKNKKQPTGQYRKAPLALIVVIIAVAIGTGLLQSPESNSGERNEPGTIRLENVPEYNGEPYVVIQDNVPAFGEVGDKVSSMEEYGALDDLGRCTYAYACLGSDLMPTEARGNISSVKPSGWQSVSYDFIDGNSLYNRCHLIGFQLSGENANECNLITGTRYLNVEGMLPFENMVADYIKETDNHVLYRVTPVYDGSNLVADGVLMEAWSVEDEGEGICFSVYCYNVQPGVEIDYRTGESTVGEFTCGHEPQHLVINTSSGKFHKPECSGARNMAEENRKPVTACPEELVFQGYEACGTCKPAA